ncbi:predicted protein [Botrytis cinerea T4]|uniref:Uncharacterized protein n=1 Tax=Botryotinia fuckeliana (strain T4) TaxID=999810 RepID=G2YA17_BOTF4|nr:predicted protein [Botrytis cinerea T4]
MNLGFGVFFNSINWGGSLPYGVNITRLIIQNSGSALNPST